MNKTGKLRKQIARILIMAFLMALPGVFFSSALAENSIVRVLLTRLNLTDRLEIALDGSYTMDNISFQRGSKLIVLCSSGKMMLYYEGMALEYEDELVLMRHQTDDNLENGLRLNGSYALYCGDLHLSTDGNMLSAVLYIPVEEYLLGVVPYEMSESFPIEALKAQAVAARSYALYKAGSSSGSHDLVDNTNDQVFKGYFSGNDKSARAIQETKGQICCYKSQPAICYYTASNGGQVELVSNVWGGSDLYITMHTDPYDIENPESTVKSVSIKKHVTDGIVCNQAFTEYLLHSVAETIGLVDLDAAAEDIMIERVNSISLDTPQDGSNSMVMTNACFELRISYRQQRSAAMQDEEISFESMTGANASNTAQNAHSSTVRVEEKTVKINVPVFSIIEPLLDLSINGSDNEIMTVCEESTEFIIESRRYGHGVGMSQRGAQWMAAKYGWTYDQILRFYYPGLTLKKTNTDAALPAAVSSEFLTTPGPAATPTPRPTLMPSDGQLEDGEWRVKVTQISANSSLNLRSAPSTSSDVLRVLYYGQELIAAECDTDGWIKVRTDVVEGYVMEKFVEMIE